MTKIWIFFPRVMQAGARKAEDISLGNLSITVKNPFPEQSFVLTHSLLSLIAVSSDSRVFLECALTIMPDLLWRGKKTIGYFQLVIFSFWRDSLQNGENTCLLL